MSTNSNTVEYEFMTQNRDGTFEYLKKGHLQLYINKLYSLMITQFPHISVNFSKFECDELTLKDLRRKDETRHYYGGVRDSIKLTKEMYIESQRTRHTISFYKSSMYRTDIMFLYINNLFLNKSLLRDTSFSTLLVKKLYFNDARLYENTYNRNKIKIGKDKLKRKARPLFLRMKDCIINNQCNYNYFRVTSSYIVKKMYNDLGGIY